MRKILLVLVICLPFVQASAQESNRDIKTGFRGGFLNSRISTLENDSKQSFYFGLQMPIKYGTFFTLQPEVVYNKRGAKNIEIAGVTENQISESHKVDLTVGYVDFTAISKLTYDRYNVHLGPGLAVLVHSSDKKAGIMEVTVNFGAGIQLSSNMGIEGRCIIGSGDISISNQENKTTGSISFQLGTYYNF
ncbi:MAG: PorT family protein [Flavobacteriaceae bacterium]|jgi:hypothetical protein|nr:PorT family protein [Flavobacteriaceae bacterium]